MAIIHTVRQGECLSSIAYYYKLRHWRVIYDHPRNAGFKARRPNPNLIYPGDELYIPDSERREELCETDRRHIFVARIPPTYVNICVQDLAKEPIKDAPFKLSLDAVEIEGTTDGKGWIRGKIPGWATEGTLKLWLNPEDPDAVIQWPVKLGHLDPLETTSGVKGRLNNLGYYCGEVNEVEDELYDASVRQFQEDHGLVVDGIVGPKTRAKLKQEHRV